MAKTHPESTGQRPNLVDENGLITMFSSNGHTESKELPEDAIKRTVQAVPTQDNLGLGVGTLTMYLATVADDFIPWGRSPYRRDKQLREFWPTEPVLSGALYSIAARNAAFSWKLDGPPRTVSAVQDILHSANLGKGWLDFIIKITLDMLTQDNGAFAEIIREADSDTSPVIGVNHLDSARCVRTGIPEQPVIYIDRLGERHKLKWYQVLEFTEMPSPTEELNGMQYCTVTRILRAAQILRDISIYKREKIGARGPTDVHIIGGISQSKIEDLTRVANENADNAGLIRFMLPTLVAGLDPREPVSLVSIPIKSLPDGFDADVELRWYIAFLALNFGSDYQEFAPLPGGGLGTSNQSQILDRKSKGKGPALFMKLIEHKFNFHGVMPKSVTFRYDEQDVAADKAKAEVRKIRGEWYGLLCDKGILTPQVSRQMMVDEGDLSEEMLAILGEQDATSNVTAEDGENYQEPDVEAIPQGDKPAETVAPEEPTEFPVSTGKQPNQAVKALMEFFSLFKARKPNVKKLIDSELEAARHLYNDVR